MMLTSVALKMLLPAANHETQDVYYQCLTASKNSGPSTWHSSGDWQRKIPDTFVIKHKRISQHHWSCMRGWASNMLSPGWYMSSKTGQCSHVLHPMFVHMNVHMTPWDICTPAIPQCTRAQLDLETSSTHPSELQVLGWYGQTLPESS